jgi:hypothetical protein
MPPGTYSTDHVFKPLGGLKIPPGAAVIVVPDPALLPNTSYVTWAGNLFTAPPKPSDVVQGCIGDCFVLAGLNSVLSRPNGPALIQAAVLDEGASVVMRLFKDERWNYVRMSKRLMEANVFRAKQYNLGSKWVRLIEKIYAAYIAGGYKQMDAGAKPGRMTAAFFGPANDVEIKRSEQALMFQTLSQCFEGSVAFNTSAKEAKAGEQVRQLFQLGDLTAGSELVRRRAAAWKRWNNATHQRELMLFAQNSTTESFDRCLARIASDLDVDVRSTLIAWYNANQPFPGPLGSGIYTPQQIDFHRRLSRALAMQRAVAVASNDTLKGRVTGAGHSAGESKSSGLVGKHAYSVTGTKEEQRGPAGHRVTLYFIGIRNLWGKYSRGYDTAADGTLTPKQQDAYKTGQAEMWIELSDFIDNFGGSFSESVQVHDSGRAALIGNPDNPLAAQLQTQAGLLKPVLRRR